LGAVSEQDAAMAKLEQDNRNLGAQVQNLSAQVAGFHKKLDETAQPNTPRPVVAGFNGAKASEATDC